MFTFDAKAGKLASNTPASADEPRCGPRHFVTSGDNKFLYLLCEMTATIVTFAVDGADRPLAETGVGLRAVARRTLVPGAPRGVRADAKSRTRHLGRGHSRDAERQVSLHLRSGPIARSMPSASMAATGGLTYLSSVPTERQPRGFAIDPSGRFLVATGKNRR